MTVEDHIAIRKFSEYLSRCPEMRESFLDLCWQSALEVTKRDVTSLPSQCIIVDVPSRILERLREQYLQYGPLPPRE